MKHILLLLAAVLFPVLILVSCDKNDEDYDWDLIASGVTCFSGAADSELVDMDNTMKVDVYQHVTLPLFLHGRIEDLVPQFLAFSVPLRFLLPGPDGRASFSQDFIIFVS